MQQLMQAMCKRILTDLVASVTAGDFAGGLKGANLTLGLFTAPTSLNDSMAFADFTGPADTGLAAQTPLVWGSVYRNQSGQQEMAATPLTFALAAAGPVTLYGWFLYDQTLTPKVPLIAEIFDSPVELVEIGDGLIVIPTLQVPASLVWGGATILT